MRADEQRAALEELKAILAEVGPQGIWRPVHGPDGELLAGGVGLPDDGLPEDLDSIQVAGRTVADLGCNFGAYTLAAARQGARLAVGFDLDPRAVRGASLLRDLAGLDTARFETRDVLRMPPPAPTGPFDVAMMIDIIGKQTIRKDRLDACLRAMAAYGTEELVFTFRPVYGLDSLGVPADELERMYPGFTDGHSFRLLDYVRHAYAKDWRMIRPDEHEAADLGRKQKYLVVFRSISA